MKKTLHFLFAAALFISLFGCGLSHEQESFRKKWIKKFKKVNTPADLKSLRLMDKVYFRKFKNGDWIIVAVEHSCCVGAGFDATLIKDNRNRIYFDFKYTWCGIPMLANKFSSIKADSVKIFFEKVHKIHKITYEYLQEK